jgi:predicted nucleic acid-binding protein
MSLPTYKNPVTTTYAIDLLAKQIARTDHEFWADDISLCDPAMFSAARILGPLQITDIYLLALAVKREGRLATLDRSIALRTVRGAEARHLAVI